MPRCRVRLLRVAGALAAVAGLPAAAGCAHPGLDGDVYRARDTSFRVGERPASWRPLEVSHASLAWRDDAREGSILLNARCGVGGGATPLRALAEQLVLGTTGREWSVTDTVPFDGREAIHGRLTAKLDGVPMAYDVFVLRKDGCIYDFVYVAPPARLEEAVPGFERFAFGFHTVRPGGGS